MINPDEAYERLVTLGEAWAEANYAADLLEETKKTERARLMNKLEGSQSAREMGAEADPLYREHIAKMCKAREASNKAKVKYDSAKMYCDLMRSKEATERAANREAM